MALERKITVRGIINRDNTMFAQKLKGDGGPNDFWSTPGGKLEPGESILEGLHREMIEETGVAPQIGRLLFVQQFSDGKHEFIEFFHHIENADDYLSIDLAKTSHGVAEVAECGFIDPTKELVLPDFICKLALANHIETAQPVQFYSYL